MPDVLNDVPVDELIEDITTYRVGLRREWTWPGRLTIRTRLFFVNRLTTALWLHYAYRGTSDRWRRTWQAESEYSGLNAQRARTERGAVRKMRRAILQEAARA